MSTSVREAPTSAGIPHPHVPPSVDSRPPSGDRTSTEPKADPRALAKSWSMRNSADWKTVLWLAMAFANVVVIWRVPSARAYLVPLQCYLALAAGIIAHNHNHAPTFYNKHLNNLLNHVATLFYGFAAFNWIPTHNANHHKFTNAPGDATITWRVTKKHNLVAAIVYPFVSAAYQAPLIDAFVKDAKARRPAQYRHIMVELVICWALPIAITFFDWRFAVYGLWIPRFFSLFAIIYFNYGQHIHCAPYSKWDHSRNFTGGLLNFLLFNNGFHTVHHMKPGSHWSVAPELHAQVAANMSPELNQTSLAVWMFKCYILAIFMPSAGTHQIGRAPYDPPSEIERIEDVGEQAPELKVA